jgi:hypothetical protein
MIITQISAPLAGCPAISIARRLEDAGQTLSERNPDDDADGDPGRRWRSNRFTAA